MGIAWYTWRASWRRSWRAALAIAVIGGLPGAVGLASLAGARRTDSAYGRYLASINASTVMINVPGPVLPVIKHIEHLPGASSSAAWLGTLPLIVTHGWPGSIIKQLKIIDPLTNPTAHRGSAADAFHLVIPSMPGYGFSGKPTTTGWGPDDIARAWAELMGRMGYDRCVAQGGGWGGQITDLMGAQALPGLAGIHTNFPGAVRPDAAAAVQSGGPAPSGLNAEETRLRGYRRLPLSHSSTTNNRRFASDLIGPRRPTSTP